MTETRQWSMDTSAFTHLFRAGLEIIIEKLAPGGVVLIPDTVGVEIERGRQRHQGIPILSSIPWVEIAVLTEEESWTQAQIKANLGGTDEEHLGECAVIACAQHRDLVAVLDDRAAIEQADLRQVPSRDTLWIIVEAYKTLFGRDRARAADAVDALLATDMYLPVSSGESLISWAYENELLP